MSLKPKLLLSLCLVTGLILTNAGSVAASTDLTITCQDEGPCEIAPAATPLFNETNIAPGVTAAQNLTVINDDDDDTCQLTINTTDNSLINPFPLSEVLLTSLVDTTATTYFGSMLGGEAQPGFTFEDLFSAGSLSLVSLSPGGGSETFTWYATFDPNAGNEYQAAVQNFDFGVTFNCGGGNITTTESVAGTSSTSSSSSSASPPVCTDTVPVGTPVLSLLSQTPNTVTLSWTGVSPVTTYNIFITRQSDGAEFGGTDIGVSSPYTVTNLAPGETYTFQILGVNGCATGERSNLVTSDIVTGIEVVGGPEGPGGVVLGDEDDLEVTDSAEPVEDQQTGGEVAGAIDTCQLQDNYLPLILLLAQLAAVLIIELLLRRDTKPTKWFLIAAATLVSIGLFYWLRDCNCFADTLWGWLCTWYWLVSLIVSIVVRGLSYAFIEEIDSNTKSSNSEQKQS